MIGSGNLVMVLTSDHASADTSLGDRVYYDPINFCIDALNRSQPVIFISINYRLDALGFLHCPAAVDILPPKNGYVTVAADGLNLSYLLVKILTSVRGSCQWLSQTLNPMGCFGALQTQNVELRWLINPSSFH